MKKVLKHKHRILRFGAPIFLLACIGGGAWAYAHRAPTLADYAHRVEAACKTAAYRDGCYNTEIPKLMSTLTMEQAFAVTAIVQKDDPTFVYCHVLGHELGEIETAKDPSKWKDVVARAPQGVCSNGAMHGAFQERFKQEALPNATVSQLAALLSGICDPRPNWDPTGLEQGSCSHALGHLAMYATGGNIARSLALCSHVVPHADGRDYTQLCYDGVFMQIYQPLDSDDQALVKGEGPKGKDDLHAFCWNNFTGKERQSCWTEGWPLYFKEIQTPSGTVAFCSALEGEGEAAVERCYNGIVYVLTAAYFSFDLSKIYSFCPQLPGEWSDKCFAYASSRMIETDWGNIQKSAAVCAHADALGEGGACYQQLLLYSTYNFEPNSPQFFALCNALPQPWKRQCLAGGTT